MSSSVQEQRIPLAISHDHPGSELVLERRKPAWGVSWGQIALIAMGALVILKFVILSPTIHTGFPYLLGLFFLVNTALVLLLTGTRCVCGISLERASGVLRVRTVRFTLCRLCRSIPFSDVSKLTLQAVRSDNRLERIVFSVQRRSGWPVKETFFVEALDKPEEVMDLAFRMGAVAGLPHYRVDRNDPREIWISIARDEGAGWERIPVIDRAAHYALDCAAPAVALPEQTVEGFQPPSFPSEYSITAWAPGRLVRFENRPASLATMLCVCAAMGVGGWLIVHHGHFGRHGWAGVGVGMMFLSMFAAVTAAASPEMFQSSRTVIDWGAQRIVSTKGTRATTVPFDELVSLYLRGITTRDTSRDGRPIVYHCDLYASWRPRHGGVAMLAPLVSTCDSRDSESVYRPALSLAATLATALGVKFNYTDFGPPR